MDPPRPLQTKLLAKGENSSRSATYCEGQQPGCVLQQPSSLNFGLAAAALFALAVVFCAGLLLMKRLAGAGAGAGAVEGNASSTSQEGYSNSDSESGDKMVGIGEDVVVQMSGATLVLFPGEDKARTLAVPIPLPLPLQPDVVHPQPHLLISLQPTVSHSQPPYSSS